MNLLIILLAVQTRYNTRGVHVALRGHALCLDLAKSESCDGRPISTTNLAARVCVCVCVCVCVRKI